MTILNFGIPELDVFAALILNRYALKYHVFFPANSMLIQHVHYNSYEPGDSSVMRTEWRAFSYSLSLYAEEHRINRG